MPTPKKKVAPPTESWEVKFDYEFPEYTDEVEEKSLMASSKEVKEFIQSLLQAQRVAHIEKLESMLKTIEPEIEAISAHRMAAYNTAIDEMISYLKSLENKQ